jgi:bacterioferritin
MSAAAAGRVKVLGYLGRALSLELSAVQQYSTHARLAQVWGLTDVAEKFRNESREEMEHVERIIARMLSMGGVPNASMLRPVQAGASLAELLVKNQQLEQQLVQLYSDAATFCRSQVDSDNRVFFETLLTEEQSHGAELAQWLGQVQGQDVARPTHGATF